MFHLNINFDSVVYSNSPNEMIVAMQKDSGPKPIDIIIECSRDDVKTNSPLVPSR